MNYYNIHTAAMKLKKAVAAKISDTNNFFTLLLITQVLKPISFLQENFVGIAKFCQLPNSVMHI